MAINTHIVIEKTGLQILAEHPEQFFLTGSRLFTPETAVLNGSDWDFYAPYSEDLMRDLISKGFTVTAHEESGYLDQSCVVIMEKDDVDVQLRIHVDAYTKVCRYLCKHKVIASILFSKIRESNNTIRTKVWNELLDAVTKGELE